MLWQVSAGGRVAARVCTGCLQQCGRRLGLRKLASVFGASAVACRVGALARAALLTLTAAANHTHCLVGVADGLHNPACHAAHPQFSAPWPAAPASATAGQAWSRLPR